MKHIIIIKNYVNIWQGRTTQRKLTFEVYNTSNIVTNNFITSCVIQNWAWETYSISAILSFLMSWSMFSFNSQQNHTYSISKCSFTQLNLVHCTQYVQNNDYTKAFQLCWHSTLTVAMCAQSSYSNWCLILFKSSSTFDVTASKDLTN